MLLSPSVLPPLTPCGLYDEPRANNSTVKLNRLFAKFLMMLRFNRVFYTFKSFGIWSHLQCPNYNSFFRDFVGHFIQCYGRGIWLRVGGGTPLILRLFCPHPPHPLQKQPCTATTLSAQFTQCITWSTHSELYVPVAVLSCSCTWCTVRPGVFDEDFSQCAVGEMLNSDSFFSAEQRRDIRLCVDSFLQHINLCIYRCINGTCG